MSNCPSSRGQGSGSRRRRRVYKSPKNREKERRWGRSVKNKCKQTMMTGEEMQERMDVIGWERVVEV